MPEDSDIHYHNVQVTGNGDHVMGEATIKGEDYHFSIDRKPNEHAREKKGRHDSKCPTGKHWVAGHWQEKPKGRGRMWVKGHCADDP